MSASSEKKTAIALAVADRNRNGNNAKPSGYWGLDLQTAHKLDKFLELNPQATLEATLSQFCSQGG